MFAFGRDLASPESMRIRTVLCPVDFSSLDERELEIALEVCRTFAAKLVLHHDITGVPGFSHVRESAKARHAETPDDAKVRLRALLDRIGRGVPAEAIVTSGSLVESVLTLAEQLPADLMVLGSHGWSTKHHASVTAGVIARARCPVLTFQESAVAPEFRLRAGPGDRARRAIVPTDLTPASAAAVGYACALARHLGIHVELLHVLPDDASGGAVARAQRVMDGFVPPDLIEKVTARVRRGEPAAAITSYVEIVEPAFVILGEHARGFIRHLLTPDTTQAVARRIRCPAWVVPASAGM